MIVSNHADWREPLYQCAISHKTPGPSYRIDLAIKEFALLGSYLDAAGQLAACEREKENLVETALHTGSLLSCIKSLRQLSAFTQLDDYDTIIAGIAAHKEILYQKGKKHHRQKRILLIAAVIVLLAALIGIPLYYLKLVHAI